MTEIAQVVSNNITGCVETNELAEYRKKLHSQRWVAIFESGAIDEKMRLSLAEANCKI